MSIGSYYGSKTIKISTANIKLILNNIMLIMSIAPFILLPNIKIQT